MPQLRILIVEDEAIAALDTQMMLDKMGYGMSEIAGSGEEAVARAAETRPELILMDIHLPGKIDGVAAAARIRADLDVPVIYVTAYADAETLQRAGATVPYGYLVKPFRDTDLRVAIEMAMFNYRAEKEIQGLNKQLEAQKEIEGLNKELEAFAYAVSHDLRAPLRAIDGFSRIILQDYEDKLDPRGVDYLTRIRNATQLMGQLIDALLALSRVTRGDLRRQSVDLSQLARSIAQVLRSGQPERQVTFAISDGLTTEGDPALLRVVMENLLANSWKFTSKHPTATIELGGTPQKDTFFVRDDGAGFDMEYGDKLFGAFERLHTRAQFEGTGIGLATVQRIVHRHRGKVWAEGAVEKGATFYFTLPKGEGRATEASHPPGGG